MAYLPKASAATLRGLLTLAGGLLQAPTLKSILETVGPSLQALLAADGALLLLHADEREHLTEFDRHGCVHPGRRETDLYRHARLALQNRTPVLLPEAPFDPRLGAAAAKTRSVSLLALPFPPVEPIGVLAAFWQGRAGREQLARQVPTLRCIGELTAAAMGNAVVRFELEASVIAQTVQTEKRDREHAEELDRRSSIEEELKRIAITDVMTGMLNRRGFFLEAERSLKLAQRRGAPSALIFADLDGLKAVNDALGHETGDACIRDGAALLKASFRDVDVVARLGGDEFAVFTFDCAEPHVILDRVRHNIERFHQQCTRPYRVAFSTGAVICDPASDLPVAAYLSLAGHEMYAQKRSNRAPEIRSP